MTRDDFDRYERESVIRALGDSRRSPDEDAAQRLIRGIERRRAVADKAKQKEKA
ncbi:TPA: hypothetical protein PL523_003558 [Cronobacter turicensis]|nr:hypothetical protein [Cronobacter malonaticus]HDI3023034.1 hypothetical protein [Cronobacter turicensis]